MYAVDVRFLPRLPKINRTVSTIKTHNDTVIYEAVRNDMYYLWPCCVGNYVVPRMAGNYRTHMFGRKIVMFFTTSNILVGPFVP